MACVIVAIGWRLVKTILPNLLAALELGFVKRLTNLVNNFGGNALLAKLVFDESNAAPVSATVHQALGEAQIG